MICSWSSIAPSSVSRRRALATASGGGGSSQGKSSVFSPSASNSQQRFGQVAAQHFGQFRPPAGRAATIRPIVASRCRAPCGRRGRHAGGGRLRDRHELQSRQAGGRRDLHLPGLAGVDHGRDAFDRERRFGDVRGEDDFSATEVGKRRSCCSAGRSPNKRQQAWPSRSASGASASWQRMISPAPGRNTSTWPSVSRSASGTDRRHQFLHGPLLSRGAGSESGLETAGLRRG